jgi:hypothetical protein
VAPEQFLLRVMIAGNTRDKLRYIQQLLGHQLPSGVSCQGFRADGPTPTLPTSRGKLKVLYR